MAQVSIMEKAEQLREIEATWEDRAIGKWANSPFGAKACVMFNRLGVTTVAEAKRRCKDAGISYKHPALVDYSPEVIRRAADFGVDLTNDDWALDEIEKRGGEITIYGSWSSVTVTRDGAPDAEQGILHVSAEAWRQYSRAFGARPATLAYFAGIDDNGPWAVRVPFGAKVESIIPKPARDAMAKGRRVLRQGDAFFVECLPRYAREGSMRNISFDPETRIYTHRASDGHPHNPVRVPFPHRVYFAKARQMGRWGNFGGAAD